jgi:hypothetical protein
MQNRTPAITQCYTSPANRKAHQDPSSSSRELLHQLRQFPPAPPPPSFQFLPGHLVMWTWLLSRRTSCPGSQQAQVPWRMAYAIHQHPVLQLVWHSDARRLKTRTYSESASAPRRTTTDLRQVGKERECVLVTQRNKNKTVVCKGTHRSDSSRLLSTSHGTGRDEDTRILSGERTLGPETTSSINECLKPNVSLHTHTETILVEKRTFHWPGKFP